MNVCVDRSADTHSQGRRFQAPLGSLRIHRLACRGPRAGESHRRPRGSRELTAQVICQKSTRNQMLREVDVLTAAAREDLSSPSHNDITMILDFSITSRKSGATPRFLAFSVGNSGTVMQLPYSTSIAHRQTPNVNSQPRARVPQIAKRMTILM